MAGLVRKRQGIARPLSPATVGHLPGALGLLAGTVRARGVRLSLNTNDEHWAAIAASRRRYADSKGISFLRRGTMTYTDTIVRQLLVTLKKDFRAFESDLKGVWDQKVDQDFGKLDKAEKDLASREAEEKSAQEAAEKAAKEAQLAKAKA